MKRVWVYLSVSQSSPTLCDPIVTHGLCPWNFPGKKTGVGCHSLFWVVFLTKGLNPGLLHCRQIFYHLSYQESPKEEKIDTHTEKGRVEGQKKR